MSPRLAPNCPGPQRSKKTSGQSNDQEKCVAETRKRITKRCCQCICGRVELSFLPKFGYPNQPASIEPSCRVVSAAQKLFVILDQRKIHAMFGSCFSIETNNTAAPPTWLRTRVGWCYYAVRRRSTALVCGTAASAFSARMYLASHPLLSDSMTSVNQLPFPARYSAAGDVHSLI